MGGAEVRKWFNDFYHPSGDFATQTQDHEIEFQIQVMVKAISRDAYS